MGPGSSTVHAFTLARSDPAAVTGPPAGSAAPGSGDPYRRGDAARSADPEVRRQPRVVGPGSLGGAEDVVHHAGAPPAASLRLGGSQHQSARQVLDARRRADLGHGGELVAERPARP